VAQVVQVVQRLDPGALMGRLPVPAAEAAKAMRSPRAFGSDRSASTCFGLIRLYDLGSTTLVRTQRCLPIFRSRMKPSFS
jgi:hypothetical protein